jgi:KEOPS complex subunit Pcc1
MKDKALVRIDFLSENKCVTVYNALLPEVIKSVESRSTLHLEKDGTSLVLKIEASDTVALRSALNSYLRWIDSLNNVLSLLGNSG